MKAWRPRRRDDELVWERFDDDLIVVDPKTNEAFTLQGMAAKVYEQCDGTRTTEEISAVIHGDCELASIDEARVALLEISRHGLLHPSRSAVKSSNLTRRELIRGGAIAAAISVPLIQTFLLPPAWAQTSCRAFGAPCPNGNIDCCSGNCVGTSPPRCA